MSTVDTQTPKSLTYTLSTVKRAERSLICSPFNISLFEEMRNDRVPMNSISGNAGVKNNYTKRIMSELAVDNSLSWLILVGILRREVDGQGITDSFRLTPLGRILIEQLQKKGWRHATWQDYVNDAVTRWFRLPF
jgi:hypothetical protein